MVQGSEGKISFVVHIEDQRAGLPWLLTTLVGTELPDVASRLVGRPVYKFGL